MSSLAGQPLGEPLASPPPSPRMMLARLAGDALERIPGVAGTAGQAEQWVTADTTGWVPGVLAVAVPGGRYELELHLVVAWPPAPFEQLAGEVRRRMHAAAKRAGLADLLGQIQVHFEAIEDPFEPGVPGELT